MKTKPVIEIDEYGSKYWYLNDVIHREDGPAVECSNGDKEWYLNGKLHRVDGPAIEFINGDKYWYLNDDEYSFEEWLQQTPLSEKEKIKLRLIYAD